jgi:aquaporin TIP
MNIRAWIAEFIGTFALTFVGIGAIANNPGLVGVALAHGFTIAVMVTATAATSGGHLNPAVTFGALLTRRISLVNGIGYTVFQCLGAITAAFLITFAVPPEALVACGFGTPAPAAGISAGQVLLVEAVLTFFLVFTVFGTAMDARAPKMGGLFIGFAVALDILMGGPITGAAMNPARHLGPALLAPGQAANIWMYWIGPLFGGGVAALVYHHVLEARKN